MITRLSPSGPIINASPEAVPEVYVDKSASSEGASGTEDNPYPSLDSAIQLALDTPGHTTINIVGTPGDYDSTLLFTENLNDITFVSPFVTYETPEVTLGSYSATDITYTMSPSPAWTPKEWNGFSLEQTGGPGGLIGALRSIQMTDADALHLAWSFGNPVTTGATFRVCQPGVRIRVVVPSIFLFGSDLTAGVATIRAPIDGLLGRFDTPRGVEFQNITLFVDATSTGPNPSLEFVGNVRFAGCHIIDEVPGRIIEVSLTYGKFNAGSYYNREDWQQIMGHGLSLRNIDGVNNPRLSQFFSRSHFMGCFADSIRVENSLAHLESATFDRNYPFGFPHGIVGLINGKVQLFRSTGSLTPPIYLDTATSEADFQISSNSYVENFHTRLHHLGANAFALLREASTLKLEDAEPIIDGSGAGLNVLQGSCYVTLEGTPDYAVLGPTNCPPLPVRPAGAWVNGESIWDGANTAGTIADYRDSTAGAGNVTKSP